MNISSRIYIAINALLRPICAASSYLQVIAPFIISTSTTWIALDKVETVKQWFPVEGTRIGFILLAALIVGLCAALPTYRQKKAQSRLTDLVRKEYRTYVVEKLERKLDQKVNELMTGEKTGEKTGQLTMSIMVPYGRQPLQQADRLHIVAASEKLRQLPSVHLEFQWDEGIAGGVWKKGLHSTALAVKVDLAESFTELGLKPAKERGGSFGHKAGVCLPISSSYKSDVHARFLGVLCVGSNQERDYDLFNQFNFIHGLYSFIDQELRQDVFLICI